ncbi:MAG: hypothetical protein GY803_10545 [Chloroflexi bacterium]|nr:hypothetical protein [Chloroflexota bacterium]
MAQFHLRFLLKDLPDYIFFEVSEATELRLRHVLELDVKKRKPFFCFDTEDGYFVAIATSALQIANCLWDVIPDSDELARQFWKKLEEQEFRMDLQVYLYGREEPLELYSSDPVLLRLATDGLDIMGRKENRFISFQDEDDETVFIQSNQLIMLVTPQSALASHEEIFGEIEE